MIEKPGIASSEYASTNQKEVANQLIMIADQIERFENSSNFEVHKSLYSMVCRQKGAVDFKGYVDHIINGRKIRNSVLGGRFFGEPAWDILLDLFEAHQTMQARCMKSVSSAAHAPLTTTLR